MPSESLSNSELAAQLQAQTDTWQTFNLEQWGWLTSTNATEDIYDPATLQTITVKTPYQWEQDYDNVLGGASSSLAVATQLLTDTQALQANVVAINDAVIAYDASFIAYLATAAQAVDDCDDSAAAAAASALAAAHSASSAGDHADDSEAARDQALIYRNEAETFKTQAQTAKTDAESEAANALTSRNEAQTFATNSGNSATLAESWASEDQDVEVVPGEYSAKHWAGVAYDTVNVDLQGFVDDAQAWASHPEDTIVDLGLYSSFHYMKKSEDARDGSAGYSITCLTAQTAAETARTGAETAETNAASSEASAASSSSTAGAFASGAAASESNAATSATDAATSAGEALNHRDDAAGYLLSTAAAQQAAEAARDLAEDWASADKGIIVSGGKTSAYSYMLDAEAARDGAAGYSITCLTAQTAAETAETNAETAETNAEIAETNAASSASAASSSASSASSSASSASSSASSASTSASDASSSASAAASSATDAQNAADSINDKHWINYYHGTSGGTTAITTTAKRLNLTVSGESSGAGHFTRGGGTMILTDGGQTKLEVDATLQAPGSSRSGFWVWLEHEGVEVPGTRRSFYIRGYDIADSASITAIVDAAAGDEVELMAQRYYGASTAIQSDNGTSVTLTQL